MQELKLLLRDIEKEVAAAQERYKAEEEAAKQKQKDAAQQQQQAKALASGPTQKTTQDRKEGDRLGRLSLKLIKWLPS